eukprot:CAMPEP_0204635732 /NCGR_PEP_ID=MMETSP0717-20131115/32115_1 /ASSEMBLY_ACC=CAM_ASM_000666 /TAXON_ID=230516 /ORGANISM="Chaetoceros curvisetus" /LENGTH=111 /DNA_ID=CAMNT_0051654547 /DNA_START=94 /DNA_END=430 /DNA_ORIENTATION=-
MLFVATATCANRATKLFAAAFSTTSASNFSAAAFANIRAPSSSSKHALKIRPSFLRKSASTLSMSDSSDGEHDYDYLVIGAGSGGIASARRAASYGAKVGVVEKDVLVELV